MSGKVYIVGAGPGDPRLITVRGLECIRAADVVVYDRLVDPALLDEARHDAERVYVGKEPDNHALGQERIHELVAMHAGLGRTVVRLKGGDPFVFGRGGEEAVFLAERGIPYEIVPGVTSAIAVPAFAGIPVTHRGIASSFAVVTGHGCGLDPGVDYAALLQSAGTVVILMGVRNLPKIVEQLRVAGIDPATPVALVANGSYPDQRTVVSRLDAVVAEARDVRSPAVIVVGRVVGLREQLRWFAEAERAVEKR